MLRKIVFGGQRVVRARYDGLKAVFFLCKRYILSFATGHLATRTATSLTIAGVWACGTNVAGDCSLSTNVMGKWMLMVVGVGASTTFWVPC